MLDVCLSKVIVDRIVLDVIDFYVVVAFFEDVDVCVETSSVIVVNEKV